jgi:hypothetical protein
MSAVISQGVVELLQESLAVWRVPGVVRRSADGSLELWAAGTLIQIARAPAGLPFRWLVSGSQRRRPVSGLPGVLRTVRAELDPNFRPLPVRIAALPLAP